MLIRENCILAATKLLQFYINIYCCDVTEDEALDHAKCGGGSLLRFNRAMGRRHHADPNLVQQDLWNVDDVFQWWFEDRDELFFMPFSCDVEGQPAVNHRLTGVNQAGLIALLVYLMNCFGSHAQKKRFSGILQRARSFTPEAILDGFELIVIPDLHPGILDLRDHERIAQLNLVGRNNHQVAKSGIARLQHCVHVPITVIVMAVEVVHKYHFLLGSIGCMSAVVSTWFLEVLRP